MESGVRTLLRPYLSLLILIKDNGGYEMEALNAMVQDVNEEQLTADEILSDHAYYFDWKTEQIYAE